ncbi:MAG: hypothetical protein ACOCWQ_05245 [Nanoarchaeota archaeon]
MEIWQKILLGFSIFLIVRYFLARYLVRKAKQRQFYREYVDVLTSPQYRVKGNFES